MLQVWLYITDSVISLYWIKHVFDPHTKALAGDKPRLLISDGFGTHESLEIMEFCLLNRIILCRLPSHTSHKLQPCDVGVFSSLKTAYREHAESLERCGTNTIGKQHFTYLYSRARSQAFNSRNILSGWSKTGLRPFNPERVLRDIKNLQPGMYNYRLLTLSWLLQIRPCFVAKSSRMRINSTKVVSFVFRRS